MSTPAGGNVHAPRPGLFKDDASAAEFVRKKELVMLGDPKIMAETEKWKNEHGKEFLESYMKKQEEEKRAAEASTAGGAAAQLVSKRGDEAAAQLVSRQKEAAKLSVKVPGTGPSVKTLGQEDIEAEGPTAPSEDEEARKAGTAAQKKPDKGKEHLSASWYNLGQMLFAALEYFAKNWGPAGIVKKFRGEEIEQSEVPADLDISDNKPAQKGATASKTAQPSDSKLPKNLSKTEADLKNAKSDGPALPAGQSTPVPITPASNAASTTATANAPIITPPTPPVVAPTDSQPSTTPKKKLH